MPKKPVLDKALRRKVAVNFFDSSTIVGHLAEYDNETYVFEQCSTVPEHPDESPKGIDVRVYVDRINCWLQELTT